MPAQDPAAPAPTATLAQADQSPVLIRVSQGDVVAQDPSGLTLRLSAQMRADLRQALDMPAAFDARSLRQIGDIDAWGLRQSGEWLLFTARLEPGRPPRDFRKPVAGGDIIADAIGPLQAILSIGGARRAGFNDEAPAFPYHILAPADDIGAVGLEGTDEARVVDGLQRIHTSTRDALIAQTLLQMRYDAMQALPLMLVRSETDSSASLEELNGGQAYSNFLTALDSLKQAAVRLGKPARVLAVAIDLSLEDQIGDVTSKLIALRALMTRIEQDMAARGLHRPLFLLSAEAGTQAISTHPMMLAHSELAWAHSPHRVALPAPGYMFEQTRFARPTPAARLQMAEMDAHAINAMSRHKDWFCPQILLAESTGKLVYVTLRAMQALVIDHRFKAGAACGFQVLSDKKPYEIIDVSLDPEDAQSLILTLDRALTGKAQLAYAYGAATPAPDAFPANRGAIRDSWAAASRSEGGSLHRWALPALVPIHPNTPLPKGSSYALTSLHPAPLRSKASGAAAAPRIKAAAAAPPVHFSTRHAGSLCLNSENRVTAWEASPPASARAEAIGFNEAGTLWDEAAQALRFVAKTHGGLCIAGLLAPGAVFSLGLIYTPPQQTDALTLFSLQARGEDAYAFMSAEQGTVRFGLRGGDESLSAPDPRSTTLLMLSSDGQKLRLALNRGVATAIDCALTPAPMDIFIGCRGGSRSLLGKLGSFRLTDVLVWPDRDVLAGTVARAPAAALALWQERLRDGTQG